VVDLAALDLQLDLMTLEVFSNLSDSMILYVLFQIATDCARIPGQEINLPLTMQLCFLKVRVLQPISRSAVQPIKQSSLIQLPQEP